MAGLKSGVWSSLEELQSVWKCAAEFTPDYPAKRRELEILTWHEAVKRSGGWAKT